MKRKKATVSKTPVFYNEIVNKGATTTFKPKKVKIMTSQVADIDEKKARHILRQYNIKNRKPSSVVSEKYSTDMKNNNWMINGQTITFDHNGKLIDGQHRLLGVIKSGTTQTFLIVYGIDPEVFDTIDNGRPRTNADVLGMDGYEHGSVLSSVIRTIIAYKGNGSVDAKKGNAFSGVNQITKRQVLDFVKEDMSVIDYVKVLKSPVVSEHISSFVYWLLAQEDEVEARNYLEQAIMGNNLTSGSINHYLFNKLLRNKTAQQSKMNKTAIIANIILGWRRHMGYSKSNSRQITWDSRKGLPSPTK